MADNSTNSLTDQLEVDLLRSMIVIVTVIFCIASFFTDENPYLSNEIALWIYFIAISPVIYLFTLSVPKSPKATLIALPIILFFIGSIYSYYNFLQYIANINFKIVLLIIHGCIVLYFFHKATKTLAHEDVEIEYSKRDSNSKSNSRKLTRRRNRRAYSRSKTSTKLKPGQYRG